ncbi:hypothetical protein LUZ60_008914 [Juncus effusus]|nr:hypothetical protein LUZ60_008914 [Juncus effusus]
MLILRARTSVSPLVFKTIRIRRLSAGSDRDPGGGGGGSSGENGALTEAEARRDAYNQLQNLDFMKATKILLTTPPKRKKFGFDFHLVQFFFACMPSLAVYLVAQYARQDMKKFEEQMEKKKKEKEREEEKMKKAELESVEKQSEEKISVVINRLDSLEEKVKELVSEKKKNPDSDASSKLRNPNTKK